MSATLAASVASLIATDRATVTPRISRPDRLDSDSPPPRWPATVWEPVLSSVRPVGSPAHAWRREVDFEVGSSPGCSREFLNSWHRWILAQRTEVYASAGDPKTEMTGSPLPAVIGTSDFALAGVRTLGLRIPRRRFRWKRRCRRRNAACVNPNSDSRFSDPPRGVRTLPAASQEAEIGGKMPGAVVVRLRGAINFSEARAGRVCQALSGRSGYLNARRCRFARC